MEAVSRTPSTLDQVARAAGVSRATASRVFSGNPAVSDEARRAVESAAAQLGYVPNRAARSLAAGRSESVGVVVPEPGSRMFADPLLPRLLRGIGEELSAIGIQMVLFSPQSPADVQRLEQYLGGGHVDAVLLLTLHESDALPSRLQARGIPTVFGGRPRGSIEMSFVDVDNQAGGRTATEHLIEQGRRVIAHISGQRGLHATADRLQGFREAMWNAALRSDLVKQDEMAAGAMWALQVLGRRVPDDVAVMGFDDSPVAASTQPPMSSVRQPIEEMGRKMARLVLSLASRRSDGPQQMILGPELALRASTIGTG